MKADQAEDIQTSKSISMVDRAVAIAELLADDGGAMGISSIALTLGLPKATTYRLLYTLCQHGLVSKNDKDETYSLGMRWVQFGEVVKSRFQIKKVAHPHMLALAKEVRETVSLGVLSDGQAAIVDSVQGESSLLTAQMYPYAPLYCSALGKALLAFAPTLLQKEYVEQVVFQQRTEHTIKNKMDLYQQLELIREQRLSYDKEEYEYGLTCIAAPVFDYQQQICAAISVSSPTSRLQHKGIEHVEKLLAETAKILSQQAGQL